MPEVPILQAIKLHFFRDGTEARGTSGTQNLHLIPFRRKLHVKYAELHDTRYHTIQYNKTQCFHETSAALHEQVNVLKFILCFLCYSTSEGLFRALLQYYVTILFFSSFFVFVYKIINLLFDKY